MLCYDVEQHQAVKQLMPIKTLDRNND